MIKIETKIEDHAQEFRDELNKSNQHNASIKEIEISTTTMLDEIQKLKGKKQKLLVKNAKIDQKVKKNELTIIDTEKQIDKLQDEMVRTQDKIEERERIQRRSIRMS